MSYEFFKPGVYYYSDQNFQEAAEYIGTIIVKPKQKDLFVELTESGFNPDLVYAQTGDRIWWTWDGQACVNAKKPQLFALMETEACLNPASRKSSAKEGEGKGKTSALPGGGGAKMPQGDKSFFILISADH